MLPVRIDWDPELPVVASQAFTIGGRTFKDGDQFPWRELGITEQDAVTMWCSRLIDCVATPAAMLPTITQTQTTTPTLYDAHCSVDLPKKRGRQRASR